MYKSHTLIGKEKGFSPKFHEIKRYTITGNKISQNTSGSPLRPRTALEMKVVLTRSPFITDNSFMRGQYVHTYMCIYTHTDILEQQ